MLGEWNGSDTHLRVGYDRIFFQFCVFYICPCIEELSPFLRKIGAFGGSVEHAIVLFGQDVARSVDHMTSHGIRE